MADSAAPDTRLCGGIRSGGRRAPVVSPPEPFVPRAILGAPCRRVVRAVSVAAPVSRGSTSTPVPAGHEGATEERPGSCRTSTCPATVGSGGCRVRGREEGISAAEPDGASGARPRHRGAAEREATPEGLLAGDKALASQAQGDRTRHRTRATSLGAAGAPVSARVPIGGALVMGLVTVAGIRSGRVTRPGGRVVANAATRALADDTGRAQPHVHTPAPWPTIVGTEGCREADALHEGRQGTGGACPIAGDKPTFSTQKGAQMPLSSHLSRRGMVAKEGRSGPIVAPCLCGRAHLTVAVVSTPTQGAPTTARRPSHLAPQPAIGAAP